MKSRVIVILLLNSLVPILFIGGISYISIGNLLSQKLQSSIRDNLRQVSYTIENELNKLNHVSMQLSFETGIGRDIERYYSLPMDIYEKSQLEQSIQNYINLITYTSPNLGFKYYYSTHPIQSAFKQPEIRSDFNPEQLPKLTSFSGITYNGLHRSMDPLSESLVFSVDRRIFLPGNSSMHIYVEASPILTSTILGGSLTSMHVQYLMADDRNTIIYSENPQNFPVGEAFVSGSQGSTPDDVHGKIVFGNRSEQGWTMAVLIPKSEYNREINDWLQRFFLVVLISLGVAMGLAWILWRTVYRPLSGINKEIRFIENSKFNSTLRYPGIAEFDFLIDRFQHMRQRIFDFITEVEQNEKKRTQLELEKLLFQINPHFIHNTLDSIRWIARLNGQDEIDRMISTLNKLLYYNMGKSGVATIGQELNALRDYVELQQMRYDFLFNVQISEVEVHLREFVIPRFILQPLVENALYHGLKINGQISVKVDLESGKSIRIEVRDNGVGMTAEQIEGIQSEESDQKKRGIGIGIYYVSRMLSVQYKGQAQLQIQSEPGKGTSMVVYIPFTEAT
ncbi:sensor histidine kinase [Paenibacillus koleovorans]|uniref:sensor histidine kinase n=1 Tax=Paenibacillus koleovorans TaxID=121608 RepID=UPI0013E35917|nr:histidine kinase [Paenibacillus koleovorans]